jgi:hypothetical protein
VRECHVARSPSSQPRSYGEEHTLATYPLRSAQRTYPFGNFLRLLMLLRLRCG